MKWFAVIVALLVVASAARAQSPDDQYVSIYNLIQEADGLKAGGQSGQAAAKYREAQTALQKFQRIYPAWNPTVVSFRLGYIDDKLTAISGPTSTPPPTPATTPAQAAPTPAPRSSTTPVSAEPAQPATPAPAPNPAEARVRELQDEVRELQGTKSNLEAKLKEALSSQPAALDPRELTKAQDRIKSLEKENDLLKVTVAQAKSKPAPSAKTLDETQLALTEANRKLVEASGRADTLAREKKELQTRLDSLIPSQWNATNLTATRKALDESNRKLAQQTELASRLALEKVALETRLKTATNDMQTAALRAENEVLKKQLASLKSRPAPSSTAKSSASATAPRTATQNTELINSLAKIAALESEKQTLQIEKSALENKVKQLMGLKPGSNTVQIASAAPVPPTTSSEDAARIKQLEHERDDLQRRLAAASKDLNGPRARAAVARVEEMENQIAALRARLGVYEARPVAYTEEELALFRKPGSGVSQASTGAAPGPSGVLSSGAIQLAVEAKRFYSTKQYDKAEEKYLQVLKEDQNNVTTLSDLALIQMQLNHLDEAEKHIRQAVALAPGDAYNLSILGQVKFQQQQYDSALDTLSRAAQLDPRSAQIQNYLGVTLSEKGMRGPAESALRKAIQLRPNYGDAHQNLAVVYLGQNPPLVELARWHYNKALAAGLPRSADLERMFDRKTGAGAGQ